MSINNILCLPDMLRGTRAFPEGFFDLIREPIRQGCDIDIGLSPESTITPAFGNFVIDEFKRLVGSNSENKDEVWRQTFISLPSPALAYFHQHLPSDCLVLSFEMPPWLEAALNERSVPFIDIRVSPLRFGRDLYIALRTNDDSLQTCIAQHQITEEELRLEASYLAANVSMHQQRLVESDRAMLSLDNAMVFIGQAPYDASLIKADGKIVGFGDYREQIRALIQGRRLLYKPHPFALWFAEEERNLLREITGKDVENCQLNAYQILSSKEEVELIGLCSGLLQEARWFNKKSHSLYHAFTPIAVEANDKSGYRQVHFHRWLSPGFWHGLLTPEAPAPKLMEVPPLAHHHARHTIDQWWDYLKVLTWEKAHSYESFERAGGAVLRTRMDQLEAKTMALPPEFKD
ncbi:MAG: hypothetical protein Q8J65_01785 [Nitrosomonadales bacterium]|nr:hypothetical protein [Nitrosomonadales bacterium]